MKVSSFFILSLIVVPVFSFLTLAYIDHGTRQAVISLLMKKEQYEGRIAPALFNGASLTASALDSFGPYNLSTSSVITVAPAVPFVATSSAVIIKAVFDAPKTYQYRIVRNIDPCTLNKLGAKSWQPIQYGTDIVSSAGADENCRNAGVYDSIDWALFSRETPQLVDRAPVVTN